MNWIIIACVGYLFLAVTFILDKYILSKSSIVYPSVYAFYSTIIMWGALALLIFDFQIFPFTDLCIALGSGVFFGGALYTLYRAVKGNEASHINPINGAAVTLTTYALSHVFLYESLSNYQLGGMTCLVVASIFLSYQETKNSKGFEIGYLWAIISGVLFAVSHVSAKYVYELYNFLPAFAWTRAGTGIVGFILLFSPAVVRDIISRRTHRKVRSVKKPSSLAIVWIAKVLGVCAVALIQYASAIGSVSIVQALSGLQYAIMFVLIYALTRIVPSTFKEFFSPRELRIQIVGIVCVIFGSVLFVIT